MYNNKVTTTSTATRTNTTIIFENDHRKERSVALLSSLTCWQDVLCPCYWWLCRSRHKSLDNLTSLSEWTYSSDRYATQETHCWLVEHWKERRDGNGTWTGLVNCLLLNTELNLMASRASFPSSARLELHHQDQCSSPHHSDSYKAEQSAACFAFF